MNYLRASKFLKLFDPIFHIGILTQIIATASGRGHEFKALNGFSSLLRELVEGFRDMSVFGNLLFPLFLCSQVG